MSGVLKGLIKYGFFDGPQDLVLKGYSGGDKMSPKQFIVMGTVLALIILLSVLLRRTKRERLFKIYKVLAVFMPVLEIAKITFSTYHGLRQGERFDFGGILPLYTCSMLLYFLPFVAWGKGWSRKVSMAFFSSIGMVAGLSNFVYLSAASWYPIFTFGGLYSVFFHAVIVFVGMSLLITGEYTPSLKTIAEGMIPVLIFRVLVIPANFIILSIPEFYYVDYMLLMNANGFVPEITEFFIDHHIRLLFSFLMLFVAYPLANAITVMIEIGAARIVRRSGGKQEPAKEKTVRDWDEPTEQTGTQRQRTAD